MDSNAFDSREFEIQESGFDYEAFEQEEKEARQRRVKKLSQTPEEIKMIKKKKAGQEAYDWVQCLVAALLFCVITFSFFFRTIGVIGISMQPTFHDGDRVLLSSVFYQLEYGDIVVLRKQEFQEEPIIKRVIATEGQVVEIDFSEGIVYVDGTPLTEPYIAERTRNPLDFSGKVTVPENCVFVMGDNRNNSQDSRQSAIGCVDKRYIIGKVLFRILPLSGFGSDF